jgi:pyridoxine kinase
MSRMILILSSFVAASPVGGGAQAAALAALDIRTVLAPTVLFGRHPGLGPPGGGPVDGATFEGVLQGIEASGAFAQARAVIAGYFADAAQVEVAAAAIDKVLAASPDALVVVDPIMGDAPKGLYVPAAVAQAIAEHLVPRASLMAPNAWELQRLTGHVVADPASAAEAAQAMGRPTLVSSVPLPRRIGVLWTDGRESWLASHRLAPSAPNGTGDLLTALFTAALLDGATGPDALETAVSDVAAVALGGEAKVELELLG